MLRILIITIIIAISSLVILFSPKLHKQVRLEESNFDLLQFMQTPTKKPLPPANTIKNQAKKASAPVVDSVQTEQPQQPEHLSQPTSQPSAPRHSPPVMNPQPSPDVPKPQKTQQQLTEEQEEIIAWNKWRSDLQNQTMKDSHLMAPVGTRFNFSFTVDKFGNISNLRIWADPAIYTGIGLKAVRPVLMSYQGQPILNFPPKSKRIIVNIQGGFCMARTAKFSSPSDYSDYERVK